MTNLQDTEKIVDEFYKQCFKADAACPLRRASDTKWEDLRARVDALIAQATEEPLSVLEGNTIVDITGTDVVSAFRRPLYSPLREFPRLAEVFAGALEGNTTGLLDYIRLDGPKLHGTCDGPPLNGSTRATLSHADASHAIMCTDGEDMTGLSLADYRGVFADLRAQSPTFAAYWATIRFACVGLALRPAYRFLGPFTTPPALTHGGGDGDGDGHDATSRPAAPLLFLSTRLDPVTPLRNARNMAARHPGAAVVVQEGQGHCTASAPSKCTQGFVRRYLATGEVPDGEAVCESDCGPWEVCQQSADEVFSMSTEMMWPRFI
jgi:pimeloyl-ACP methyl ester carboxylesterase